MGPAPVDYLEALRLKRAAAEITLGGRSFPVQRARLHLHYELRALLQEAGAPTDLGALAGRYVIMATGLSEAEIDLAAPDELLAAFGILTELNAFRGTLPVLWPAGAPGANGHAPEDYPNRALASMVTRLSHAYGWGVDHILELGPEEAACYLQEVVMINHQESEAEWRMRGGGVGEKGEVRQFPKLRWGRPPGDGRTPDAGSDGPVREGVPARFMPMGVVIRPRARQRRKAPDG